GGIEYIRAIPVVEKIVRPNAGEHSGVHAILDALAAPCRQLLSNAAVNNPQEILHALKQATDNDIGFNVDKGITENLRQAGVIDPVKSLKEALILAFSYAKGIIQTAAWDLTAESPKVEVRGPLVPDHVLAATTNPKAKTRGQQKKTGQSQKRR